MRTTISSIAIIAFIVGTVITSCQSSAKKVENAKNNLQEAKVNLLEAKQDLNKVRQDSITEYQKFKKESEEKITAHEISIANFKARIATEKKENKDVYEKRLTMLEQKNSDLKKKLEDYKEEGKDKWITFRNEFNHDMEELGNALKDFTVKNVK